MYNVRWVVRGFLEIPDKHFNYDATHAPVASNSSLLIIISLVVRHDLHFKQLDVKTACLNSPLEHRIWVRFSVGYVHPLGHSFAKLRTSLYGLRQAAADWYELQHRRLMAFDLARSKADPSLYYKVQDGQFFFVLVHVDYAVAHSDQMHFDAWLSCFRGLLDTDDYLDIKLIGDVTHLLQMRITRINNVVGMDQDRQIIVLATEYGVLTPMSTHLDLAKGKDTLVASLPFKHLVGALLWIGRHTHPEIMQLVVYLAQFCTCYDRDRFLAALRVLKYLCTVQGWP